MLRPLLATGGAESGIVGTGRQPADFDRSGPRVNAPAPEEGITTLFVTASSAARTHSRPESAVTTFMSAFGRRALT